MCANCDFCENIAWVFGVNWVFGAFLIYPIYPKNPKYYFFVFSSPFKQQFRKTNSFSFDYADSPYHLITSTSPSYGLPANTFSDILIPPQKVRRNLRHDYSPLKINAPFLIRSMAEVALVAETFRHSATSATCRFHSISLATNRSPPLNEIRRLCRRLYRGELIRNPYKFDYLLQR